jgi:mannose/cellobiose epimerase-like protein (N-acyl-D-glucosamine 2-epimerase family)
MGHRQREVRSSPRPPEAEAAIAEQARAALRRHVLETLVPRCVDREHGGFLVDFDERWRPTGPHDKTLEHAARMTMTFALLDRTLPEEGYDRLVRYGCAFLQEVMWDATHGGFFVRVDRNGRPRWDGLKHPHAVTYAAEAFLLARPYLPCGDGMAWASRALAWLDDVAWDPIHGGYWGSFRRDNQRYLEGSRLPTPDGRDVLGNTPGFKEMNIQGDAIEMLTGFVEQGLGERSAERLAWLVDLVVNRLCDSSGVLPYLYRADWRPVPDLLRVGHQVQSVHRMVAASAALGGGNTLVAAACRLVDFILAAARHPAGGFCFAVTADGRTWPATGPSTDLRVWWVQLEVIRALHVLATHEAVSGDARARYRRARDEQWAFVRDHLLDARYGGVRELPDEGEPAMAPARLTLAATRCRRWPGEDSRLEGPDPRDQHVPPARLGCMSRELFLRYASNGKGIAPRFSLELPLNPLAVQVVMSSARCNRSAIVGGD